MATENASALNDLDRTNATQIMVGTVVEVDTETGKTTVNINKNEISGIRVMAHRAGANGKSLWLPAKDEQVIIVSPINSITKGVIIGSIYYGSKTENKKTSFPEKVDPLIKKTYYPDGTTTSYDSKNHELLISLDSKEKEEEEETAENKKNEIRFYKNKEKSGLEFKLGEIMFAATQEGKDTAVSLQKGKAHIKIQADGNISIETDNNITFLAENINFKAKKVNVEKK